MTIARREPFAVLEMGSALDRAFGPWMVRGGDGGIRPVALNMYETEKDVVIQAYLPGCLPEEVDVTVEQGHATIRARRSERAEEKVRWLYRETYPGQFARSIMLPDGLHSDKAEATFEHGILTLRFPKTEEARPQQIKIVTKN